ncbi:hypothetical protein Bca4012_022762 [Brassica carinata]
MATMLLSMQLPSKLLFSKLLLILLLENAFSRKEVRESHASKADMKERIDEASLDIFFVVVIETFHHGGLHALH